MSPCNDNKTAQQDADMRGRCDIILLKSWRRHGAPHSARSRFFMIVDTRQVAAGNVNRRIDEVAGMLPRQVDAYADQVRPLLEEFKSGRG
jgi:hypothetical protein